MLKNEAYKKKQVFQKYMVESMEEIGKRTETDKIWFHGYHRFYQFFLEQLREKPIVMLEVGIEKKKSLKMWQEYFPKAKIYGIDINLGFKHETGEVFKGDQSDIGFLNEVIGGIGKRADLIIDDGSHVPEHQLKTFCHLFLHLLKPGGIYTIEDIEANYWKRGATYQYEIKKGYKHPESNIEIFKDMIDKLNKEYIWDKSCFKSSPIPEAVQNQIGMISFGHNCIIIVKKDESYAPFDNRKYRFPRTIVDRYEE